MDTIQNEGGVLWTHESDLISYLIDNEATLVEKSC